MPSSPPSLGSRPVRDVDDRPIGRVAGAQTDRVTGDTTWLLVELVPEAARTLDRRGRFCWLPYDAVSRIRRDAVHLGARLGRLLPEPSAR